MRRSYELRLVSLKKVMAHNLWGDEKLRMKMRMWGNIGSLVFVDSVV